MDNLMLTAFVTGVVLVLLIFFKIARSKARQASRAKTVLIEDLQKEKQARKKVLESLKKDRQDLFETIKALNSRYQQDLEKSKINEEEMFEEIVSLEARLNTFIAQKQQNDEQINQLKSEIRKYERRKSSKNKRNAYDFLVKRFAVLYKETIMNRKAISGFLNLNGDLQIKAEECIRMLDQNLDQVTVKRKVFSGKKHKTACFEVLFAYNGRLYFRKNEKNQCEILVIGTKNTQSKDMGFLHDL